MKKKPNIQEITNYIGIDPGSQGGIAVMYGTVVETYKMRTFMELYHLFKNFNPQNSLVMVERVGAWQSDADIPGKSVRIAKMISGYQQILDALEMAELSYIQVVSYSWQKQMKVWRKAEEQADRKKRFKEIASQIFQKAGIKPTLWNADALLLVNFCHMVVKRRNQKIIKKIQ